jgi:hypothetical protein
MQFRAHRYGKHRAVLPLSLPPAEFMIVAAELSGAILEAMFSFISFSM